MTKRKSSRTRDQKEIERIEIVRRWLQGEPQESIAASLGITQQQVSLDIKIARQRWKDAQVAHVDDHINKTIAEIELVKQEAWKAWEDSKGLKQISVQEVTQTGEKEVVKHSIRKEQMTGNAAYLNQVLNCIEDISELRNLPTELKYQDINTAIRTVMSQGYEVRESEPTDEMIQDEATGDR